MSKKFRRSLLSTFIMVLVCVFTFTFVGCKDKDDTGSQQAAVVWTIEKAYAQAQSEGFTGTYEEFLQNLSSISDISLDDVGRLTFTLSNGTVIVAGTVTEGVPGRGIEQVVTEADRWGLVITNTYTFSDGESISTSYTTGAMYGREYDVETISEFDYLIEHGVGNIVLAEDIGSTDEDYENVGIYKDLKINLNEKTFYAKNLTLSSSIDVEIAFKDGYIQTIEGIDISAEKGTLSFTNICAFDKEGEVELNASTQSIHFKEDLCFGVGMLDDYYNKTFGGFVELPDFADVVIPADTRVVFEYDDESYTGGHYPLGLNQIVVTPVEGYKLVVLNQTENSVTVNGETLAYGNVNTVDPEDLTTATVAFMDDYSIYATFADAYKNIENGEIVGIIADATWNIEGEDILEVAKEFSVYYVNGTLSGNYTTKVKPAVGYVTGVLKDYVQIDPEGEPQLTEIGFYFARCPEHDFTNTLKEGYCGICGEEDSNVTFVVKAEGENGTKYTSLDKALDAGETTVELLAPITLGTEETAYVINREFTIIKNYNTVTFTNVSYTDCYYLDETDEDSYKFLFHEENEHNYDYDYCTQCGHKDGSKTYVARIGDREYSTIENIFAQGHHVKSGETVVVDLLANATWTLTRQTTINYELTINKNSKTFTVVGGDEYFLFTDSHYVVDNETVFKVVQCEEHNYYDVDDETLYVGYCQECGHEDEQLRNNATIQVDGVKYISLQNFIDQGKLVEGIGEIQLLRGADLSLDREVVVNFELVINYKNKTAYGNFKTMLKAGNGYIADSTNTLMFKVVACTEHTYTDGTCTKCGKVCEHTGEEGSTCSVCGESLVIDPQA